MKGVADLSLRAHRTFVLVLVAAFWGVACDPGESVSGPPEQDVSPIETATCVGIDEGAGLPNDFRPTGKVLVGDVDGDQRPDRVTLRISPHRPERCRRAVVVELEVGESLSARLEPLEWPSSDPKLLLLANVDGHPGSEPVVALSPGAVYRPGAVFTISDGVLVRMRLRGKASGTSADLFPFYDEFPTGVDCTQRPGEIALIVSEFAPEGDDSVFAITRSFYRSEGTAFRRVNREEFVIDCCNGEARKRWPETANDPFRSCGGRVQ